MANFFCQFAVCALLCTFAARVECRSAATAAAEYAAMEMMEEKSATSGDKSNQCGDKVKDRIYTFAFCGEMRPYHFIDAVSGKVMGLGVDLVNEACAIADKLCDTIVVKDAMYCWNNEKEMSRGLDDKWYDSIVDMVNTMERSRSYSFVGLIAETPMGYLYAREGSHVPQLDKVTHKIGFSKSSWLTESCLMKTEKYTMTKMMYDSHAQLKMALNDGEVDFAFLEPMYASGLKRLEGAVQCATAGPGVMVRKDMAYEMWWVDDAMKKVMSTDGKYERFCYIAEKLYGGNPMCIKM